MRTIESFEDYVDPIQEAIDDLLLPTLFGQTEFPPPSPSDLRQHLTLTSAQGGLGVPDLRFKAPQQSAVSTSITAPHVDCITTHVHGDRRGFHGRVKKTTSSLENRVGEIENGFHSTLGSAAVS